MSYNYTPKIEKINFLLKKMYKKSRHCIINYGNNIKGAHMKNERKYKVILKKRIVITEVVEVTAFTQSEAFHKAKELAGPDCMPKHHAIVTKVDVEH